MILIDISDVFAKMKLSYDSKEWANMYTIIYMKADYEPWWKFEGWEAFIQTQDTFEAKELFERALQQKLSHFRSSYDNEATKEGQYWAFWSEDESFYCDACDDDAQVYHGIIACKIKEK
ncbi:DUF1033 family protein [Lysinibacillus cavernae]|uniref:DUF1033 family protein n=1 Tax=Lysinibacillus cavernae TaxID=2666135 RepID=UPI001E44CE49|nr:DUF1033 family protein [Lysinibacillus cavernae]